LQEQHFVLDSNEKKVKVGKSNREGWVMKVLRRERWRMKIIPVIKPGRLTARKAMVFEMIGSSIAEQLRDREKISALVTRVKRQARKMRMNLQERKPPRSPFSGRMWQTPLFRAFAMPRLAVIKEVTNVITNNVLSPPR